jgi:hypothetical protein
MLHDQSGAEPLTNLCGQFEFPIRDCGEVNRTKNRSYFQHNILLSGELFCVV